MSLKTILSAKRNGAGRELPTEDDAFTRAERDKLAMLEELERTGLGWFWASDADGRLTYLSAAFADRLETAIEELLGRSLLTLFQPPEDGGRTKSLPLMLGAHKSFAGLNVRAATCADPVVLRLAGHPLFDEDGAFRGFRGTGSDITVEFQREQETARLVKYDTLTGLSNRHRMAHQIEAMLTVFKLARRNCAVLMLDLDRFKHVNDMLGHAAGDELLRQVAERLGRVVGSECEVGRLGGDEFQILIPDVDDRGMLGDLALKVITMLRQPYSLEEGRCVIGASVGIAIAPHDGVSCQEITRAADLALYAAKNSGRGQYRFFSAELENETIFRRRLEEDLVSALQDDALSLRYEPITAVAGGHVRSLEAHICWQHPDRGEIDELEFAQILQGSSQVCAVGIWAIERACQQAVQWPDTIRVAVNVPTALFVMAEFVGIVAQALQESGLAPPRLELEIGEAVFLEDANTVDRTLAALFKLGVRLTLDEFGSGYSSLAYLRRAPFDAIKVDRKLLAGADQTDDHDLALMRAIVALANALSMETIVGGIETSALLAALRETGARFAQGPIYCEPVEHRTVLSELAKGTDWQIAPTSIRKVRARRRTVFRKIQVIHDDYAYDVTLRNLSRSGALIQGLQDVPKGKQFVVDLGGGQLAVATVNRSNGDTQGLEFEHPLIDDGAGGLCTRHRVSPYALASAGTPLAALASGSYKAMPGGNLGEGATAPLFAYAKP